MARRITPEEELEAFYARCEMDLDMIGVETRDMYGDEFAEAVENRLGLTLSDDQKMSLADMHARTWDIYAPAGVKAVIADYPWGTRLGFGIKGQRGFFGYERMMEITGLLM